MVNKYTSPENANRIQVIGHGYKTANELESRLQRGDWTYIESANIQQALQASGFDSFQVLEGGKKNLAVFSANQVKSATETLVITANLKTSATACVKLRTRQSLNGSLVTVRLSTPMVSLGLCTTAQPKILMFLKLHLNVKSMQSLVSMLEQKKPPILV